MGASVSSAQPRTYGVLSDESRFVVNVGRSGLFKVFGHDHVIRVGSLTGAIEWDDDEPEAGRFHLEIDATSLSVADDALSDDDRATVQNTMEAEALAVSEHATIMFVSWRVELERAVSGEYRLEVNGELALRGVRDELSVPLTLTRDGDRLVARAKFVLDSKKWGVPQISALGGSVKTKSELGIELEIVTELE